MFSFSEKSALQLGCCQTRAATPELFFTAENLMNFTGAVLEWFLQVGTTWHWNPDRIARNFLFQEQNNKRSANTCKYWGATKKSSAQHSNQSCKSAWCCGETICLKKTPAMSWALRDHPSWMLFWFDKTCDGSRHHLAWLSELDIVWYSVI